MTLISILLALALEYFLGPLDRFRNFHWFEDCQNWLEVRCQRTGLWDGAIGVLLTVGLPVAVLLVASVMKVTLSAIRQIIMKRGSFAVSDIKLPMISLKPDSIKASARQIPPLNSNNTPQGIS